MIEKSKKHFKFVLTPPQCVVKYVPEFSYSQLFVYKHCPRRTAGSDAYRVKKGGWQT